jgi:hypothetical protein
MMRKMADIMMSQYMSMQRIDSINRRIRRFEFNEELIRWGKFDTISLYEDSALDTMAILWFKRYVELQSTWKTSPNSATTATDILYVCETLKVLPWMDYAMTAEEFAVLSAIPDPRPYALNPWSPYAKHPIRLSTISEISGIIDAVDHISDGSYYKDFTAWVKLKLHSLAFDDEAARLFGE